VHETGLAEAIVDAVLQRAAGRRVTGMRVRIGGHPVDAETVMMGIRLAAAGTVAQEASVDLIDEPMSLRCNGCGHTGTVDDHLAAIACPRCGAVDIDLTGEDAIVLEAISVEAPRYASQRPGGPRP
jgi:hydrogenase nickel incorporation protein HypA/HybF